MVTINIRDFNNRDLTQVASLLAGSFREDINRIIKLPDDKMTEFIIEMGEVFPLPFPGYVVAENDGEIMGVMILRWPNQEVPKNKLRFSKALRYGLPAAIKLIVERYLFPEKPGKETCHVAELAVKENARKKGIGTTLLDYGKSMAKEKGLKKYTLHVDAENKPALRLYERTGFELVKKKKNILARWLLGVKVLYFMSQDINV
ncbi:GNAT family N-acetyltransferase [Chloroflexota bacterium]